MTSTALRPHGTEPDGNCRKDCRICEDEDNEWRALNDPKHTFHGLHVCRAKGRDGSPTLDEADYELDYDKVMNWFKPKSRASVKAAGYRMEKSLKTESNEEQHMLDACFEKGAAPRRDDPKMPIHTMIAIKEKVEKDIGVPYHKVDLDAVKDWEKRGFQKAKQGEYTTFSSEDRRRFMKLTSGSALRK